MPPARLTASLASSIRSNAARRATQISAEPVCQCRRQLSVNFGGRKLVLVPSKNDWPQIRNEWRKGFRKDPIGISVALLLVTSVAAYGGYYWYSEQQKYKIYPKPIALKLRQAIAYDVGRGQPVKALEAFKEALVLCQENGMDSFSNEVIGIKVSMAALMEKYGEYKQAISAMEGVMRECIAEANKSRSTSELKKKRTRLLKWSIEMGVKLGELYTRPEVWERDAAEARLSWAVETMVKEQRRREEKRVVDEEGEWFSREELAATIESLAQTYESKNQHYLASPLYLHAINLHPQKTCHSVVLMNNLASALSQQSPRAAAAVQEAANTNAIVQSPAAPVTRQMLLEMAQTWAGRALEVAASIKPPERNEECDVGCVVATHNLGEIAEMTSHLEEAKRRYSEALSLARAIGFEEGVEQSLARLRRLEGRS